MDKKKVSREQDHPLPGEHRGMPTKNPQAQDPQVGKQLTERDGSAEASLHLPHERDQSVAMTETGRSPDTEQAYRDETRGLKDTSKQPEMDAAYKKQK
jgi:hypothetical protein